MRNSKCFTNLTEQCKLSDKPYSQYHIIVLSYKKTKQIGGINQKQEKRTNKKKMKQYIYNHTPVGMYMIKYLKRPSVITVSIFKLL